MQSQARSFSQLGTKFTGGHQTLQGMEMEHVVRVWDLPTRVFHWALVSCVVALVVTGEVGGDAMVWHFRIGYTVLALLLFRLIWGFVGGRWSRFASFVHAPATVLAYLQGRGKPEHGVGHNPLGAGSVLALLGLLLLQVVSGTFSDDEIAASGPMTRFVANSIVSLLTKYHAEVGKSLLILLVLLHIGAIVYYKVKKRDNLVPPMLHGDKQLGFPAEPSRDDKRSRSLAAAIFLACALSVAALVRWLG